MKPCYTGGVSATKRILLVPNRFHPQLGGAELNIFWQAKELAKHFAVDVITPLRDRDPTFEETDGIRIFRVPNVLNRRGHFPDLAARTLCPSVFTHVAKGDYDLVHCFPSANPNSLLAAAAAKLRAIPALLTNFDVFDYVSLLADGMPVADLTRQQLTTKQKLALAPFQTIFTISRRETALIGAVNSSTELSTVPILLEEYQAPVDKAAFRKKMGIPADKHILLCLSRISRIKGQDIFIRALPALKAKFPNFIALVVGRTDYEPEFLTELQHFVDAEGLSEHVRFTGPLPREDVIAALGTADFHVLPQRFMNSGAVVVETWAARRPVIQSRNIDPVYAVDGDNGFTFDIDDPAALTDKMLKLLSQPELGDEMGKRGRALVERKFLYPHLIQQYMSAYARHGVSVG